MDHEHGRFRQRLRPPRESDDTGARRLKRLAHLVAAIAPGGLASDVRLHLASPPPGFTPFLYVPPDTGPNGGLAGAAERIGVAVRRALPRRSLNLSGWRCLLRTLGEDGIDVAHVHHASFVDAPFLELACRLAGVKRIVATEHAPTWSPSATAPRRLAARLGLAAADVVCSPSREGTRHLGGIVGSGRTRTLPSALAVERYLERPTGELLRCLGTGRPARGLIGSCGLIDAVKDPELFAAVAGRLAVDGVGAVWIGDGPGRAGLEAAARVAGAGLVVTGWVADPAPLYPDLDVFVMTSRAEGLPLALLEAMACGRAVAAVNVGGIPDVIKDGETGVLVQSREPDALAGAIRGLLADPGLRLRLGAAARDLVRREHTPEARHPLLLEIYRPRTVI